MGISLANFQTDAQSLAQDVDQVSLRIGNVAEQVLQLTQKAHQAVNTPIVISTPTASQAGSIGFGLPTTTKVLLFAVGGFFLLALVLRK